MPKNQNQPPQEVVDVYADMMAVTKKHNIRGFTLSWINGKGQLLTLAEGNHEAILAIEDLTRMYIALNAESGTEGEFATQKLKNPN